MALSAQIYRITTTSTWEFGQFLHSPNSNPNCINGFVQRLAMHFREALRTGTVTRRFGGFFHWISDL